MRMESGEGEGGGLEGSKRGRYDEENGEGKWYKGERAKNCERGRGRENEINGINNTEGWRGRPEQPGSNNITTQVCIVIYVTESSLLFWDPARHSSPRPTVYRPSIWPQQLRGRPPLPAGDDWTSADVIMTILQRRLRKMWALFRRTDVGNSCSAIDCGLFSNFGKNGDYYLSFGESSK